MYWLAFFVVSCIGFVVGCYFLYRAPRSLHSDLSTRHVREHEIKKAASNKLSPWSRGGWGGGGLG
jgi:hypothetical protein